MSNVKFYKRCPQSPTPPFQEASYLEIMSYYFKSTQKKTSLVPEMIDWYYEQGWIIIPITQTPSKEGEPNV